MTTQNKKTHEPIQDLEGEIWKPIVGYEGYYEVSNKGRVKSLRNNIILKQSVSKNGYYCVGLSINNKPKTFFVHQVVYETFIGKRPKGHVKGDSKKCMVINHKDENPLNNCAENLEVISHYENVLYGTAKQRQIDKLSTPLYQYSLKGELIRHWQSSKECGRNGFHTSHVSESCQGIYGRTHDRQVYNGFIWSYTKLTKKTMLGNSK